MNLLYKILIYYNRLRLIKRQYMREKERLFLTLKAKKSNVCCVFFNKGEVFPKGIRKY